MPVDIPVVGARSALWLAAQIHLYFAAFVLGAPIFIVVCEYLGIRTGDARYERLAKETMKVVAIAYSLTALTGVLFSFILMGPYQRITNYLFRTFYPVWGLYGLLIVVETVLMYVYWYSWEPLSRRKTLHMAIGVLLNIVGTVVMLLVNAIGAFMLTPPANPDRASLWALVNNASWWPLNLHRFIANITFGGLMVTLFASFMFLTAKREEERAFYDWMGFIGNFIGVATLMLLPLAGYIYAKEIFLYDATIATFM
ncbi:MAG: cytochrome ubiquinol oxidase subunit I, partial [Armatimonadetes bacterium]|nr:cytochrome ubiquinol oxidase subunit I [Armatimonadota bacterium]